MKITYDPEVDVLGIVLKDIVPVDTDDLTPDIFALKDSRGEIVRIEILDASKHIDGDPATVSLQLLTEAAVPAS